MRVRPTRRSLVEAALAAALFVGLGVWMVADSHRSHLGNHAVRNPEANVTLGVVLIAVGVISVVIAVVFVGLHVQQRAGRSTD